MYVVYGLVDPRDKKPFYVGITDNIYKRFLQHVNCNSTNYEKNKRITELRTLNLMVIVETLEQTPDIGYARIREAYWIKHYEILGYMLTNIVRPEQELKARILVRSSEATKKLVEKELIGRSITPASKSDVTPDERARIIGAAMEQRRLNPNGKIVRTKVMEALEWHRGHFPKVKKILDQEGL